MTRFIDSHRDRFGVEPICHALEVAPSNYYAHKARPPSARAVADEGLKAEIKRVYKENFEVYGAEKLWRQLAREGIQVGRDRVARLMRALGIHGVVRGKPRRTTIPDQADQRPADLVNRDFTAPAPNRLWVADLTDVPTWAGFCYAAFIIDAYSRAIVGWRIATTLRATLALDALEMAIWARQDTRLDQLVHHSDSEYVEAGCSWSFLTRTAMDVPGCRCRDAPGPPDPHSDRRAVFPRICRWPGSTRQGARLADGVT